MALLVWENVEGSRQEKAVRGLQCEIDQTAYENALLRSEINRLVEAPRLRELARTRFGLAAPGPEQIIRIEGQP